MRIITRILSSSILSKIYLVNLAESCYPVTICQKSVETNLFLKKDWSNEINVAISSLLKVISKSILIILDKLYPKLFFYQKLKFFDFHEHHKLTEQNDPY